MTTKQQWDAAAADAGYLPTSEYVETHRGEQLDRARAEEAAKRIKNLGTYGGSFPVYSISAIIEAARLAREGWTPPVAVDPDLGEAAVFENRYYAGETIETICLQAIKRGRELERAEAKPGMVWVKHDQSNTSPVPGLLVTVKVGTAHYQTDQSFMIDWYRVTHYAVITPPDDVA